MQTFPLNDDKSPACIEWKNYKGPVNTPMWGVTPPPGFYVIDADIYKDADLIEKIEKQLGCSLDWDGSHIQTTKRGGRHHAFIIPEGARMKQDSDLFDIVGFDARASGRGYIATGEGYQVIGASDVLDCFDDFLPELPQAAFDMLVIRAAKPGELVVNDKTFRAEESLVTNQDGSPLKKSQMLNTLKSLPDEVGTDNSSWMTVCAGLKRQLLAMGVEREKADARDGWGFKVLTKWSRGRFDGNDEEFAAMNAKNFNRWTSFSLDDEGNSTGGIITFKTLINMAGGIEQSQEVVEAEKEKVKTECGFAIIT